MKMRTRWTTTPTPATTGPGAAVDRDSNTRYEPWTDGWAVGYRVTFADGRVEYFYLNPSGGSDDGVPNVFVYQGAVGDPAQDAPLHHYDLTTSREESH